MAISERHHQGLAKDAMIPSRDYPDQLQPMTVVRRSEDAITILATSKYFLDANKGTSSRYRTEITPETAFV